MAHRQIPAVTGILAYFARHRTAANLLLVVMIALGVAAAPRMRAQFFPDVVIDNVSVSVRWDGAGAEDIDSAIVQVLEPTLLAVEGVESSSATSSEGRGRISLDFEPGWDMARAADDVQSAVDSVSTLPVDAEDPEVRRGAWRDRVTDVVIHGPVGVDQLGRFADEFTARLFQEGVTRVTIQGVAAPETVIEVPSIALIRNNVTMREIAAAIAQQAAANPAGDVAGSARIRTGVERRSADQIGEIVLRSNPDGSKLLISDVASLHTEGVDRNRAYFVGPNSAISIRVDRTDRGDAIGIQRQVEEVAAEMQLGLPRGVRVDLIRTRAEAITGRLNILLANGLMGMGFVVLLLFLFLNARTAFWVAAGIPVAMTAAIALMYAAGLTLNMISLFALIITLGIVVDDAIVVGEHADFRVRRLGEAPMDAAINAATRMFPAVFSATLTTIIAFVGLIAVGGRFGNLIADIPFTVIVVLIASLAECFLILPNHMAHAMAHSAKEHWYDWPSRTVNKGFVWFRRVIFRRMMAGVIWLRYPVLAGTVLILASQVALFVRGDVTWRFFSSPEQGSVSGNFAMAPGATRSDTIDMMRVLQQAVADLGAKYEVEFGVNPVAFAMAEIGGSTGRGLSGVENKDTDLLGSIAIELIDADLRPYSSFRFVGELQDAVPAHPLLETLSFRSWGSGPGGDALEVEIFGASAEVLKFAAEALKTALAQFPEVSALEDTLAYDKEELILDLTAQGQALGISIDDLGRTLRDRLNGIEAATYPDGPRSASITVALPKDELTADFMDRTQIRTGAGDYVSLADIVTVQRRAGFSTVKRENGLRLVSVNGDISDDDPARAAAIQLALKDRILPKLEEDFGVTTKLAGLAEQENAFLTDAAVGFGLCLLGIFLTLAWIFSSWTRPLVVMAIIPFGLVGTIYGHALWDVPLTMFSVVGIIGMTGIIINDSIVLVGTIDEYAAERGLIPAIIDGTADRLRPVFLTTATTVLGLAPLLYESSAQAQFLKPTVVTLVYGLGFGFVLVLLVVPALLAMQQDVARQMAALRRAVAFRRGARGVGFGVGLAVVLMLGWGAATLGSVIVSGGWPAPLAGLLPGASVTMALGVFLAGVAAVCLAVYVVGALTVGMRRGVRS
ncbi:efflux RND transporter permease subunit [Oceaniovalibus sp. ACAM 378]|uniref:efflux RND transporter permease subunit n=1 Tax=Oceaniovalibus sp. ACAM 378 TaxID=2599923 RepID=UPI0011D8CBE2|nr:efflux RND transporter permease subunit [Oceaniovalibus sp. ACAM 378]TYB89240.1 efflux RND transporter permease subunit [Oceaniovalibus sp. ACAM 378]